MTGAVEDDAPPVTRDGVVGYMRRAAAKLSLSLARGAPPGGAEREDVEAVCLAAAWRAYPHWRPGGGRSLFTYLYTSMVRAGVAYCRKAAGRGLTGVGGRSNGGRVRAPLVFQASAGTDADRPRDQHSPADPRAAEPADELGGPEQFAADLAAARALAVRAAGARGLELLEMRARGMTLREVGAALGVSHQAVQQREAAVLARVRAELARAAGGGAG